MKKILLASTILVGSAGIAAADVSFSGKAFMGVDSTNGGATWGPRVTGQMDVAMSSETDGGLMFGADATITFGGYKDGAAVASGIGDVKVWISGDFGKVSMKHKTAPADVTLGYEGTFGNFGVKANYGMLTAAWDIKLSYDFGNYDAYVKTASTSVTGIGGSADFGDFGLSVDITDISTISTTWDIGVTYDSGAVSVKAHAKAGGAWSLETGYDLGGGASIKGTFDNAGKYALGVSMKF